MKDIKGNSKKVVTKSNRATGYVNLKDFCSFAKENEFIEVTTWTNCEGYDIFINYSKDRLPKILQLSNGEFNAINTIIKQLNK